MILPRFRARPRRRGASNLAAVAACILALACASAPSPSAASLALRKNPRATIAGRVVGEDGSPVGGISVFALPHGKDIPWPPPSLTDADGRFRLTVFAPAEYGFLLRCEGRSVVTSFSGDPAHLRVAVSPGDRREGIEIVFPRKAWDDTR